VSAISTHVLDTVLGKPAAGVGVRLERQDGGGWIEVTHASVEGAPWTERVHDLSGAWTEVARSTTDGDGRCSDLGRDLAKDLPAGVYRIVFDTGSYLRSQHRATLYPEVAITFTCDGEAHYHLPLLLSDNSYTTYRGS
jgi:5-hydroxyisourate hydrolase